MAPIRSEDPDGIGPTVGPFDVLYVDAMNVIGSRPDGWWRDRNAAVTRFVDRLADVAGTMGTEVVVVIDGRPVDGVPAGRIGSLLVVYAARRGPDAADDRIIELIDEHHAAADDGGIGVVTADRALRERASARGASVIGARHLLAVLDAHETGT